MKKLILGLLTSLGIAYSGANLYATTLADNIGVAGGISVSNFTTDLQTPIMIQMDHFLFLIANQLKS